METLIVSDAQGSKGLGHLLSCSGQLVSWGGLGKLGALHELGELGALGWIFFWFLAVICR